MKRKSLVWFLLLCVAIVFLLLLAYECKNRKDNTNDGNNGMAISGFRHSIMVVKDGHILIYFDRPLGGIVDPDKIIVGRDERILRSEDDYTLGIDGKKLIVTSTNPGDGGNYSVNLQAGMVRDMAGNTNVSSGLVYPEVMVDLDENELPWLMGQKIVVPFDGAITILDKAGIRYQLKASAVDDFGEAVKPSTEPVVTDGNRLEIILDSKPVWGEVYRIYLEAGSVGNRKGIAIMEAIAPTDKDIIAGTFSSLAKVRPVFAGRRRLIFRFPGNIILRDFDALGVESRDNEGTFANVPDWSITPNGRNSNKIIITLGHDASDYTQDWRLSFPVGSLMTPGRTINDSRVVTNETILRLSDTYGWEKVEGEGLKWSKRSGHTVEVFRDKIWVLGGWDGTKNLNDVWSSVDGINWVEESARPGSSVGWLGRNGHGSVVFRGRIWILGGGGDVMKKYNDVWSSVDGINWVEESARPGVIVGWLGRNGHSSVVFRNKIWILGGFTDMMGYLDDVWSSTDGRKWVKEDMDGTPWNTRFGSDVVVFDDKMWMLGGFGGGLDKGDVWFSADGREWTEAVAFHVGDDIYAHLSVVFEGRIWTIGGTMENSVWSSANPLSGWVKENKAVWAGRSLHKGAVFQDKIWILGGKMGKNELSNQIWTF